MEQRRGRLKSAALSAGAVVLLVGTPAVGAMVYDSMNAHKVDGKHAVAAGASLAQRGGKLVATDTAGRLPNNIIKKAPNAAKLGGAPASAYVRSAGTIAVPFFGPWFQDFGQLEIQQYATGTYFTATGPVNTGITASPPQMPSVLFGKKVRLTGVNVCYDALDQDVGLEGEVNLTGYSQTSPGSSGGTATVYEIVDLHNEACRTFTPETSPSESDSPGLLGQYSFVNFRLPLKFIGDGGEFAIFRTTFYFEVSNVDA
jgi:hypothetical protein